MTGESIAIIGIVGRLVAVTKSRLLAAGYGERVYRNITFVRDLADCHDMIDD